MSLDRYGRPNPASQQYVREMPLGNGLYVIAGKVVTSVLQHSGPNSVPVVAPLPTRRGLPVETVRLKQWLTGYDQGLGPKRINDDQDTLDANWQRERVADNGIAYAYKLTDGCGGGLTLGKCALSEQMLRRARLQVPSPINIPFEPLNGDWQAASDSFGCNTCSLYVQTSQQVSDGKPTGFTRVAQAVEGMLPQGRL